MRLNKRLTKVVALERVCRVATTGRSRVPHVVPVCHILKDGKIYFGSDGDAKKVQNLRQNPRAAVTVDVYDEDWSSLRGVTIQGDAALIENGTRFKRLRNAIYEKFPQYPQESALTKGSVIVEITPRHVFSWGLE